VQVATNFANECLDFRKGADTPDRLGPTRAVAAGLIAPARMWVATGIALAVAGLAAAWLSIEVSIGYAFLGLISGMLALAYTGGPLPLAYVGLGDLFVLAFFGVVAVVATGLALGADLGAPLVVAGVGCGLLSTAILAVNNLRDREGDARARKLTLAVRLGERFARLEFAACVAGALACFAWLAAGQDPMAYLPCVPSALLVVQVVRVLRGLDGRPLNGVLASTGSALLATAVLFALVMTRS
jgi:1,4-dihydroxy-2-naphthoate octaprenyltransferase